MKWTTDLATSAEALIREVGAWIQMERRNFQSDAVETKSLNALVSYVDRKAEARLVAGLSKLIPSSGFLGEEGEYPWNEGGYNWIIDPLDGTTNFIHSLPPYAISVALMEGDALRWACIFELGQGHVFTASQGEGAFCEGQRLKVSDRTMAESLVATGFPYYDFSEMGPYLAVLQACFKGSRGVRRFGSAATDLAWVADDRFQAFFEHGLAPWDVAAGILIVREAGGVATTFSGACPSDLELINARQLVAGHPKAHATLVEWTQTHFQA
ncbi:MAG: hypothetical protein RL168_799 [Bacteroidota bacterium]